MLHRLVATVDVDDLPSAAGGASRALWGAGAEVRGTRGDGAQEEWRLAWLWVEGWRERLRKSGDIVEKSRWEWRLDGTVGRSVEVEVAPRVPALKTASRRVGEVQRKSVRFS